MAVALANFEQYLTEPHEGKLCIAHLRQGMGRRCSHPARVLDSNHEALCKTHSNVFWDRVAYPCVMKEASRRSNKYFILVEFGIPHERTLHAPDLYIAREKVCGMREGMWVLMAIAQSYLVAF